MAREGSTLASPRGFSAAARARVASVPALFPPCPPAAGPPPPPPLPAPPPTRGPPHRQPPPRDPPRNPHPAPRQQPRHQRVAPAPAHQPLSLADTPRTDRPVLDEAFEVLGHLGGRLIA